MALVGPVLLVGLLGSPAPAAEKSAPGCVEPSGGQPNNKQWPAEPPMAIDQDAKYTATLETNCGAISIALDAKAAPHTVNSFVFLAGQQYFDHTKCHRLTTEGVFVLQCGDPKGDGTGGPGYTFPDENLEGATYPAGTVAMANSGPNTNGSQFFLVYKDSPLPPNYTPFGQITQGTDVLQTIAAAGTKDGSGDGAPAADATLDGVTVSEG
ncbi:peptidylprolyl isomerase [Streptomyces melanogenes]|uniref:Peptidyl-prolyl cis-trans isomerase n=1 Tax=Streptomyces melanogenes TaxID=67326 RepID=A0ABZ1XXD8_9ACTN